MNSGTEIEIQHHTPARVLSDWTFIAEPQCCWILSNYGYLSLFWQCWGFITYMILAVLRSGLSCSAVCFWRLESPLFSEERSWFSVVHFWYSQLCSRTFAWMAGQVAAHSIAGEGLRGQWLPCQCTRAGAGGHLAAGPNHAPWLDPSDSTSSVLFPLPKHRTCRNVLSLTSSSICQVWIKLLSCSKREEEREMYEWTDCVII